MNVINEKTIVTALLCFVALAFNFIAKDALTETNKTHVTPLNERLYMNHNFHSKISKSPVLDPLSVNGLTKDKTYWS